MASLLRGSRRSYNQDLQKKEHKRKLVLKALEDRRKEQEKDKILLDVIAAVPRSTPDHIDEVVKKVRKDNDGDADKLEEALAHCRNLDRNLTGAKPSDLWSDTARMVWVDAIESVTKQTSRWKACPLVMVHPYCGTIEVLTSLCGKHQALSEYARMRLFAAELRDGLEAVLDDIHPIKDAESGHSLPFEETKEILLDLSGHADGNLSEDDDEGRLSEDNEETDLEANLTKVTQNWSLDKIKEEGEPAMKSRLISPALISPIKVPGLELTDSAVNLTTTPPPTMNQSRSSSEFSSPLHGYESPRPIRRISSSSSISLKMDLGKSLHSALQLPQNKPDRPRVRTPDPRQSSASRTLFQSPDRQVMLKPTAPWQITAGSVEAVDDDEPTPLTPSPERRNKRAPSDLSNAHEAYPDGFTIIPIKNNRKKSDVKKGRDKKRPVSSPNLPATKTSRMDRTEVAIEQLQMGQADQNKALSNQCQVLQKLADQMNQFSFHLAMQNSKNKN